MTVSASQKPEGLGAVALIVAAGSGERAGAGVPKQYRDWQGMPLLRHSLLAFARWPATAQIVVAIGEGQLAIAERAAQGIDRVRFVTGGASRRESVLNGLESIAASGGAATVYIHDAARPGLSSAVLDRLAGSLVSGDGAVPVLPVVDSLSLAERGALGQPVPRDGLWRVQTPQAFRFDAIWAAHRAWPADQEATDDARIAQDAGLTVATVEGDEALRKITFAEDFAMTGAPENTPFALPDIRTGSGYDVHRLAAGEELWLGGLKIDHDRGLAGHSDADVALHALTDAVLGAMAMGDIGEHFPPSDPQWRGASSDRFLAHAAHLVREAGGVLLSVDLTIICEAPRIGPHKQAMRQRIAAILAIEPARVSVKATTTERLGFTGRGEGIAAQAVATVAVRPR